MSYPYKLKTIISGKQIEVYKYSKYVWRNYTRIKKKIIKEIDEDNDYIEENNRNLEQISLLEYQEIEKEKLFENKNTKKKRSKSSLHRTKTEIRRLINSNIHLNKFITLTFAKNITDLKEANYIFNQFIKRMNYEFKDFEYLAVPEFQKRGAVHYHMLCNLPFMRSKKLEKKWGQGFIRINKIDDVNNVGAYVSKYLNKETNEINFRKKKYFRSQGLKKPVELFESQAEKFIDKFLVSTDSMFHRTFMSEWLGEINYNAYSLDFAPFESGVFERDILL